MGDFENCDMVLSLLRCDEETRPMTSSHGHSVLRVVDVLRWRELGGGGEEVDSPLT